MWSWRKWMIINISSVQFSCSVVSDSLRPHEPKHTVKPPVHHQLLESTQTHVHCVSNAIQPFCPLSSPFPPPLNLSQHQGLFKWVPALCIRWPKYWSSSFNISPSNEHSGLISFRMDWLDLQSKGLSRVFSNTVVQKHQFFSPQFSLKSNSHIYTWLLENS